MRHGDVAYFDAQGKPVPDPDKVSLSEKGKAQADATGAYLKTIGFTKFDRVPSSDLPRTVETGGTGTRGGRICRQAYSSRVTSRDASRLNQRRRND